MPLWQHVMVRDRLMDLFELPDDGDPRGAVDVSTELVATIREQERRQRESRYETRSQRGAGRRRTSSSLGGSGRGGTRFGPSRADVIERLERARPAAGDHLHLQPGRVRRGACSSACASACGSRRRTRPATIRDFAEEHTADLAESDLAVLGYWEWLDGLEHGLAAHHAGLLPTFKEVVEQLFARGLIKAVFATETLALGINMPARSVVLERLVKWNGETHADITPGEYTQLTGRAGRRGIDVEGHAVVVWQPGVDPVAVAGLAST